mgnify:CR=1 FL=1
MNTWQKIGVLFGLPASATEKEIDAEADTRLAALNTEAEATDKGADASAMEVKEEAVGTAAPEATADIPTLSAADVAEIFATQLSAALKPLNDRLSVVEGADAAEETGGGTEAPEVASSAPIYTQNPVTARVAAKLAGKK